MVKKSLFKRSMVMLVVLMMVLSYVNPLQFTYADYEKGNNEFKVKFMIKDSTGKQVEDVSVTLKLFGDSTTSSAIIGTKVTKDNGVVEFGWQDGNYQYAELELEKNGITIVMDNVDIWNGNSGKPDSGMIHIEVEKGAFDPKEPEVVKHKVTFDLMGGNISGSTENQIKEVEEGNIVEQISDPSLENFKFVGWYLNIEDETAFDFSTKITSDITVYARWTDNVEVACNYILVTMSDEVKEKFDELKGGIKWVHVESPNAPIWSPSGYYYDGIGAPDLTLPFTSRGWYMLNSENTTADEITGITLSKTHLFGQGKMYFPIGGTEEYNPIEISYNDYEGVAGVRDGKYMELHLSLKSEEPSITYTVKFYDANDEVISNQTVKYKEKATLPEDPTKENAIFIGWNTEEWKSVTRNLDIKPIFESLKHKVTFNLNGGNINGNTDNIEKIAEHGTTIDAPESNPSIQDGVFNGWYLDKEGTKPFDLNTGITSEITLYANYLENGRANLYVIKPEQTRPAEVTGNQTDYSTANYINIGSAKYSKNFTQQQFAETQIDTSAVEKLLSDKTTNSVVNNGVITTVHGGYVWTANYADVDWYVIKTKDNPGNIDGEAIWTKGEAVNYKIEYSLNAEDAKNDKDNVSEFTVNDEVKLKDAQRSNYNFDGWYTTPDFKDGSKVTGFAQGTTGDKKVYAKWSLDTEAKLSVYHYYVPNDYVIDDATNPYITVDNTVRLNYEEILNTYKLEKVQDGYLLRKGNPIQVWGYKMVDGKTQNEQIMLKDGEYNIEGCYDVRIHIAYDLVKYNIEYVLNATDATNNNVSKFTVKDEVKLNAPSRPNYNFEGWYTTPDFAENSKVTGISKGTTGDQKVYAKWSLKTYTVSIEYKYADGVEGDLNNLPANVSETYNVGSNYKYDIKNIYGFTASHKIIEGTDIRANQKYVVTYSNEEIQEITVNFYKDSNNTAPMASEKVTLFVSELDNENIEDIIIERVGGIDAHRPEGYEAGQKTYFAQAYNMEIVYAQTVQPEEPEVPETPERPERPERPEKPEDGTEDFEDEEVPGGEITNDNEDNDDVNFEDEEVPGGAIPENNEDSNLDIADEEIPGGVAQLPDTAGLTAEILYGLGALAVISGIGFKRKNK